jgi:hypothetical protein
LNTCANPRLEEQRTNICRVYLSMGYERALQVFTLMVAMIFSFGGLTIDPETAVTLAKAMLKDALDNAGPICG